MSTGSRFNEGVAAFAQVLDAIAWPVAALILAVLFRSELGGLLVRIREFMGVKLDPAASQQAAASVPLQNAIQQPPATVTAALATMRTPAVERIESLILNFGVFQDAQSIEDKNRLLLALAARAAQFLNFESADSVIFQSQIRLLEELNGRAVGLGQDRLRTSFFEPAAHGYPELYREYSFDQYLTFLKVKELIEEKEGLVAITDNGKDYLKWRVDQAKRPVTAG